MSLGSTSPNNNTGNTISNNRVFDFGTAAITTAAGIDLQANTTLTVELVNGAINSQAINDTGVEANLDVQFAGGVSWPVKNIFYSTYGRGQNTQPNISYEDNGNEPYDIFIGHLLKKKDHELPQTLTTSYGSS